MKVAVASEQGMVTEHFGHCESFMIFDTVDGQIVGSEVVPNPGHKPGFLPRFLHGLGVKTIISGGMGASAVEIFNECGIEVIVGVGGSAKQAVEAYVGDSLQSTGSVCHEHKR